MEIRDKEPVVNSEILSFEEFTKKYYPSYPYGCLGDDKVCPYRYDILQEENQLTLGTYELDNGTQQSGDFEVVDAAGNVLYTDSIDSGTKTTPIYLVSQTSYSPNSTSEVTPVDAKYTKFKSDAVFVLSDYSYTTSGTTLTLKQCNSKNYSSIYIPDTYTLNGTTYNVAIVPSNTTYVASRVKAIKNGTYKKFMRDSYNNFFLYNNSIRNVVIGQNVTITSGGVLGNADLFFAGMKYLIYANLPDNIQSAVGCFYGCISLKCFGGNYMPLDCRGMFIGCLNIEDLSNVKLPDVNNTNSNVYLYAFDECYALTKLFSFYENYNYEIKLEGIFNNCYIESFELKDITQITSYAGSLQNDLELTTITGTIPKYIKSLNGFLKGSSRVSGFINFKSSWIGTAACDMTDAFNLNYDTHYYANRLVLIPEKYNVAALRTFLLTKHAYNTVYLQDTLDAFDYTVDYVNKTVTLMNYKYACPLYIPATYDINGISYTTLVNSNTIFTTLKIIRAVQFADDVLFVNNVADNLFNGCTALSLFPRLSHGLVSWINLFYNCTGLNNTDFLFDSQNISMATMTNAFYNVPRTTNSIIASNCRNNLYGTGDYVQANDTVYAYWTSGEFLTTPFRHQATTGLLYSCLEQYDSITEYDDTYGGKVITLETVSDNFVQYGNTVYVPEFFYKDKELHKVQIISSTADVMPNGSIQNMKGFLQSFQALLPMATIDLSPYGRYAETIQRINIQNGNMDFFTYNCFVAAPSTNTSGNHTGTFPSWGKIVSANYAFFAQDSFPMNFIPGLKTMNHYAEGQTYGHTYSAWGNNCALPDTVVEMSYAFNNRRPIVGGPTYSSFPNLPQMVEVADYAFNSQMNINAFYFYNGYILSDIDLSTSPSNSSIYGYYSISAGPTVFLRSFSNMFFGAVYAYAGNYPNLKPLLLLGTNRLYTQLAYDNFANLRTYIDYFRYLKTGTLTKKNFTYDSSGNISKLEFYVDLNLYPNIANTALSSKHITGFQLYYRTNGSSTVQLLNLPLLTTQTQYDTYTILQLFSLNLTTFASMMTLNTTSNILKISIPVSYFVGLNDGTDFVLMAKESFETSATTFYDRRDDNVGILFSYPMAYNYMPAGNDATTKLNTALHYCNRDIGARFYNKVTDYDSLGGYFVSSAIFAGVNPGGLDDTTEASARKQSIIQDFTPNYTYFNTVDNAYVYSTVSGTTVAGTTTHDLTINNVIYTGKYFLHVVPVSASKYYMFKVGLNYNLDIGKITDVGFINSYNHIDDIVFYNSPQIISDPSLYDIADPLIYRGYSYNFKYFAIRVDAKTTYSYGTSFCNIYASSTFDNIKSDYIYTSTPTDPHITPSSVVENSPSLKTIKTFVLKGDRTYSLQVTVTGITSFNCYYYNASANVSIETGDFGTTSTDISKTWNLDTSTNVTVVLEYIEAVKRASTFTYKLLENVLVETNPRSYNLAVDIKRIIKSYMWKLDDVIGQYYVRIPITDSKAAYTASPIINSNYDSDILTYGGVFNKDGFIIIYSTGRTHPIYNFLVDLALYNSTKTEISVVTTPEDHFVTIDPEGKVVINLGQICQRWFCASNVYNAFKAYWYANYYVNQSEIKNVLDSSMNKAIIQTCLVPSGSTTPVANRPNGYLFLENQDTGDRIYLITKDKDNIKYPTTFISNKQIIDDDFVGQADDLGADYIVYMKDGVSATSSYGKINSTLIDKDATIDSTYIIENSTDSEFADYTSASLTLDSSYVVTTIPTIKVDISETQLPTVYSSMTMYLVNTLGANTKTTITLPVLDNCCYVQMYICTPLISGSYTHHTKFAYNLLHTYPEVVTARSITLPIVINDYAPATGNHNRVLIKVFYMKQYNLSTGTPYVAKTLAASDMSTTFPTDMVYSDKYPIVRYNLQQLVTTGYREIIFTVSLSKNSAYYSFNLPTAVYSRLFSFIKIYLLDSNGRIFHTEILRNDLTETAFGTIGRICDQSIATRIVIQCVGSV